MKKKLSVTMVTKNQYKIDAMRLVLTPYNIDLDVENFYVPEIQADAAWGDAEDQFAKWFIERHNSA